MPSSKNTNSNLTHQEQTEKFHFDELADNYDNNYGYKGKFFEYKKNKKLKRLKNLVRNKKMKLLEIGCGTGEYTRDIISFSMQNNITAVDISKNILKIAKNKCKSKQVKFIQASVYKLPFKDNSFDLICGFYIAHHLDLKQMFIELSRVLKTEGVIYLVEPNILNPIVYLIKNISYLKNMVGDSPGEYAINPISINSFLDNNLQVQNIEYTEYLPPTKLLRDELLIKFDKVVSLINKVPVLKFLGGSVILEISKK